MIKRINLFCLHTTSLILISISSDEYFLCVDVPLRRSISQYCANNSGQRDSARVVRVVLEKFNFNFNKNL
jgi:hypothetical protein